MSPSALSRISMTTAVSSAVKSICIYPHKPPVVCLLVHAWERGRKPRQLLGTACRGRRKSAAASVGQLRLLAGTRLVGRDLQGGSHHALAGRRGEVRA